VATEESANNAPQGYRSTETGGAANLLAVFLGTVRRRWKVVIGCCVLAAVVALGLSLLATKMYTATASLLFREPTFTSELFGTGSSGGSGAGTNEREAATNLSLVRLKAVDDLASERIDGAISSTDFRDKISISSSNKSEVVAIRATDSDPATAQKIANTFAATYVTFRQKADRAKVANARELVESRLNGLSPGERKTPIGKALANQVSRLQTLQALQTGNAEIVQHADLPTTASSPKPVRNTIAAALVGLLLGLAAAFLLERLDRRLRNVDEFEDAYGMPVLTAIPDNKGLNSEKAEDSGAAVALPHSQAFQMLRTRLRYFNVDRDIRVVLVTSAAPGDGKSTTAWETAATAAASGTRALLIEAEFHRPTVATRHKLRPVPGLAEVLTHQSGLEDVAQNLPLAGGERGLDVITAGSRPPNPTELLESQQMQNLLTAARERYDFVVIDCPPVLVVPDPIPLMKFVDGVIVIGSINKTTRDEARRLSDQLRKLHAPTLGVVANRVRHSTRRGGYGDYYYYGDASSNGSTRSSDEKGEAEKQTAKPSG
jgi:succinoglycan biosynthesis transport protein ExoP